jgi:hypothetical protein
LPLQHPNVRVEVVVAAGLVHVHRPITSLDLCATSNNLEVRDLMILLWEWNRANRDTSRCVPLGVVVEANIKLDRCGTGKHGERKNCISRILRIADGVASRANRVLRMSAVPVDNMIGLRVIQ